MDLELTDEQNWLSESIESLLARGDDRVWDRVLEFGGLDIGEDGLGAVELCLIARAFGAHLTSVPYLGSAAVRYAGLRPAADAVAVALLEPNGEWAVDALQTGVTAAGVEGEKAAVEHAMDVDELAVVGTDDRAPAVALVPAGAAGITVTPQRSLDPSVPLARVELTDVTVEPEQVVLGAEAEAVVERLLSVGGLLAAAEAVGAAEGVLREAVEYASQRRQFGRTIGSYQALRHILADMYVRQTSAWSSVLYAAAALDDGAGDARRTASVAKAYASRAGQEVAHGAMQVFGGIAFTEEHPAHRFLRRIVVRGQQFGDAGFHERALGRELAGRAAAVA